MSIWQWLKDIFNKLVAWCIKGYKVEQNEKYLEEHKHCDMEKHREIHLDVNNGVHIDVVDLKEKDKVKEEEK